MIERSICYFKTRGERRAIKGDKRGRQSCCQYDRTPVAPWFQVDCLAVNDVLLCLYADL